MVHPGEANLPDNALNNDLRPGCTGRINPANYFGT